MTELKDRLGELAAEVDAFDVSAPAYRMGIRRRRRRRLAVPAAVAALAVVVVGTVGAVGVRGDRQPPGTPIVRIADTTTSTRVDWIPPTVHLGAPQATLPTDHGIGSAALTFAYRTAHGWRPGLVAADGTRYALPAGSGLDRFGRPGSVSLSPDGRFLAYREQGSVVFRDLAGASTTRLPGGGVLAWSSNSAWLVVGSPSWIGRTELVRTATGRATPIRVPATGKWTLSGITNTGRLWLFPDAQRRELTLVDPDSGTILSRHTVHLPADLKSDERVPLDGLAFGPPTRGDTEMLLPIYVRRRLSPAVAYSVAEDILAVDLRTGQPIRRYDLPRGVVAFDNGQSWSAIRYLGGDIVAVLHGPDGSVVELVDATTGARRTVSHIVASGHPYQMPGHTFF
ncbi:MAG TPA: hypothetical protein VGN37_00005 [Actinocatenispora sp.]